MQRHEQLLQLSKILSPTPKVFFPREVISYIFRATSSLGKELLLRILCKFSQVIWHRQGEVNVLDLESGETKERHYVLLNDMFFLTKKTKKKLLVRLQVDLRTARIHNLFDGQSFLIT